MNIVIRIKNYIDQKKFKNRIPDIAAYRNIDGWLTDREAYGLYSIAGKMKSNGVIVEIGSWKGKSTYCLAKGLREGLVYAIDPFNAMGEPGSIEIYENSKGEIPLIDQFTDTMVKLGVMEKIQTLQGFSDKFANNFKEIDFLFIDGDHSIEGCDYDFLTFSPFVRKGGFIAFHDFDPERDELGPTWVIKNRISKSNFRFYKKFDSLWVGQRV